MGKERRCWKCKRVAELKEMRYDLTGRDLVCAECFAKERMKGKEENTAAAVTTATLVKTIDTATKNNERSSKIKSDGSSGTKYDETRKTSYQCGSCGFGFSKRRQEQVGSCPYCGRNTVRIAFRDSMQRLIEEAEKEGFEN